MPEWARYFVQLGAAIADVEEPSKRTVAAVATPTRAFASALCAAGVVGARIERPVAGDTETYLQYLKGLPPGTTVTYRQGPGATGLVTGWLAEFKVVDGKPRAVIKDSQTGATGVPFERLRFIQPAARPLEQLPRVAKPRAVRAKPGLVSALLGPSVAADFLAHSRLDCILVGSDATLRAEILETLCCASAPSGEFVEGRLQDLLRVRRFCQKDECFRCGLVPAAGRPDRAARALTPAVVVFDGAASFRRWNMAWRNANWIVILDRADLQFEQATQIINDLYLERIPKDATARMPSAPFGIDTVTFAARVP
jgi:hypothetical protein